MDEKSSLGRGSCLVLYSIPLAPWSSRVGTQEENKGKGDKECSHLIDTVVSSCSVLF